MQPTQKAESMGYNTVREAIDALRLTPELLAILVRNLTPEQARWQPAEGEWSVLEVVCHLRDVEDVSSTRFRAIRDQDNPVVVGADALQLARDNNYLADDLQKALAEFTEKRAATVAELSALTPEQWERTGRHASLGSLSILNNTLHAVWHDANHLAQIARLLP